MTPQYSEEERISKINETTESLRQTTLKLKETNELLNQMNRQNEKNTTQRAQKLIDASMQFTLRPRRRGREKLIAFILREAADRLCTDVGKLQDPVMVLREFADESYKVDEDT